MSLTSTSLLRPAYTPPSADPVLETQVGQGEARWNHHPAVVDVLKKKAQALRKSTGNDKYHAAAERKRITFKENLENILARPFKILFQEPMLIAITLYMSVG